MPLIEPPKHVRKALKNYDSDLDLEYDDNRSEWWFLWKGQRFLRWEHHDGVVARATAHLTAQEALHIIKKADTRDDGGIRIKAIKERARENRLKEEAERQKQFEYASERAADRARVKVNGKRQYVQPFASSSQTKEKQPNA